MNYDAVKFRKVLSRYSLLPAGCRPGRSGRRQPT